VRSGADGVGRQALFVHLDRLRGEADGLVELLATAVVGRFQEQPLDG